MSDKASITVRYDIAIPFLREVEVRKGFFTNYYMGFNPIGLVSRTCTGVRYFVNNADVLRYSEYEELFRRVFDVDYANFGFTISRSAVEEYREKQKLWKEIPEELEEMGMRRPNKEDILDDLMFCDADFGQVIIDISGEYNEELENNGLTVKYAILRYFRNTDEIMSIEQYMDHYKFDDEIKADLSTVLEMFHECASLMTKEEMDEFNEMDVIHYLEYNQRLIMEEERKIEEARQKEMAGILKLQKAMEEKEFWSQEEWEELKECSIKGLGLADRTSNRLRRNKYKTVGKLIELNEEEVLKLRNFGRKAAAETLSMIERVKKKLESPLPLQREETNELNYIIEDNVLKGVANPAEEVIDVVIPEGVREIASEAFDGCRKIKTIEIPEGVEVIHRHAFGSCHDVEKLVFPKSLKVIEASAFDDFWGLLDIIVKNRKCKIDPTAFRPYDSLLEFTYVD